jgi:hypothetical protein
MRKGDFLVGINLVSKLKDDSIKPYDFFWSTNTLYQLLSCLLKLASKSNTIWLGNRIRMSNDLPTT